MDVKTGLDIFAKTQRTLWPSDASALIVCLPRIVLITL
jgi:hypothetical protein